MAAALSLLHSSNSLVLLSFSRHHFTPPASANHTSPFPIHHRRSSLSLLSLPGRCFAANSGPPLPPPDSDDTNPTGLAASLSEFQDRAQIFFAVLFWMSLFFWASVWDDKDRPNKGSRFRR